MKNFICFFLIGLSVISSCNVPDSKEISDDELERRNSNPDSLIIGWDSLMSLNIELPPVFDYTILNAECVESFNELARETGGELKIVANSNFVTRSILDIVENYTVANTDIMIIIDKTSSMQDDLDNIKRGLIQIVSKLEKYEGIRLAISTYGDRNVDGSDWYDYKNFESDFSSTKSFINRIRVTGGGDYPESVYDGIYKAFNEEFWKSNNKRIVILLGDAPSLSTDSNLADHSASDIIQLATENDINMNFYPIVLNPSEQIDDSPRMESIKLIDNIYPNPTSGLVAVKLNTLKPVTMEIFNQSGKLLSSEKIQGSTVRTDLSSHENGLYVIRVYDEMKNYDSQKVILSK